MWMMCVCLCLCVPMCVYVDSWWGMVFVTAAVIKVSGWAAFERKGSHPVPSCFPLISYLLFLFSSLLPFSPPHWTWINSFWYFVLLPLFCPPCAPSSAPSPVFCYMPLFAFLNASLPPKCLLCQLSSQSSRMWTAPYWRPTTRVLPVWWSSVWQSSSWWQAGRDLGRLDIAGPPPWGVTLYR